MMQITDPPPRLSTKLTTRITGKYQYIRDPGINHIDNFIYV